MAKVQPLKLSDLKPGLEYPIGNWIPDGRCLIHVKLTELCMKSVEGLMNSDKGAFFSLWFEESGGTMVIPISRGEPRKFQFKTAPLREAEGRQKGSLECVHQAMEQPRHQHQLTCRGPIEHRLTVQATEDVYDRTKKLMKEVEEQRKEARAQEIKLPSKGRSKTKTILANAGTQPSIRKSPAGVMSSSRKPHGRPPQQHKVTPSLVPKLPGPKPLNISPSSRSPKSLKERIIHLLALKPQRRGDIVTRLKKDTKRSESAMTNLDSILTEVSDIQQGTHNLKNHYFTDLQVDDWPFYSEHERQLVRRIISKHSSDSSTDVHPLKRPLGAAANKHTEIPPKRPKLSHPSPPIIPSYDPTARHKSTPSHHSLLSSQKPLHVPPPAPTTEQTQIPFSSIPPSNSTTNSIITTISQQHPSLTPHPQLYTSFVPATSTPAFSSTRQTGLTSSTTTISAKDLTVPATFAPAATVVKEPEKAPNPPSQLDQPIEHEKAVEERRKREKKKKRKKEKERSKDERLAMDQEVESIGNGSQQGEQQPESASSTTSIPDFTSQFPRITSYQQRTEYKRIFNDKYMEYLKLKECIDAVTMESEALSEQMSTVPENSEKAKEVKYKIREKYAEVQRNTEYQEQKKRFEELHQKLSHIKQLVVEYDNNSQQQ